MRSLILLRWVMEIEELVGFIRMGIEGGARRSPQFRTDAMEGETCAVCGTEKYSQVFKGASPYPLDWVCGYALCGKCCIAVEEINRHG
jgi:hypothetical protein